ncbi:aldo/keto reductase [Planobispora takensis]|uniref:Oxidoreductase n=1 Tax=Planobispora takensis TaxID=1367882 RepID=A0A8J3WQK4_9ACTN|nr:aldo/keto reductase [Planobispora takensis]GIH98195.1 oxidoreductase [Planobispora takensis]
MTGPNAPGGVRTNGLITLGTNAFGWTVRLEDAPPILESFIGAGGTHVDTADTYPSWAPGCAGGESETGIGGWLADNADRRGEICIATKVGCMPGFEGLSRENIRTCVDNSLRRLRTDYVDVLYFHMDDPDADMEDSVRGAAEVIAEGKVRNLAVSNYPVQRLEKLLSVCDRIGAPRPILYQGQYHLLNRSYYENFLAERLRAESIPFMPHSSLANGFLTGKYTRESKAESARSGIVTRYFTDEGWKVLDELLDIAGAHGVTPAAVALSWARSHGNVTSPAVSVSAVGQLPDVMTDVHLSGGEVSRLDAVSEPFAADRP